MGSPAEEIKDILNVAYAEGGAWDTLGYKPSFCLVGKDRADQSAPRRTIFIREETVDQQFTLNETVIFADEYCTTRLVFSNHDDRENAFADVKTLLKNSSYSLIYDTIRRENVLNLFILSMRIKLLR